jgi:predicted RNA-binding protein with PIN domain
MRQVAALKEDGCPKVWVATSDHSQQHAAYGAVCILLIVRAFSQNYETFFVNLLRNSYTTMSKYFEYFVFSQLLQ